MKFKNNECASLQDKAKMFSCGRNVATLQSVK